ncbi:uncharacterized protein LOC134186561 [Corticium candelabrum]|uniref:uncharacterized protein LOC134186561 n=1 Tax=Corticium candelabrum TaxID=121492 RepID=UPI002E25F02E|nr:uncharacterized protein LOC134186561 [Corticium candelabrum]
MLSSTDRSYGPQKSTTERRSSRNRTRRNSIPDIKELSTEVKEKLRIIKRKSSEGSTSERQFFNWEQNFVQYLEERRSSNNEKSRTSLLPSPVALDRVTHLAVRAESLSDARLFTRIPHANAASCLLPRARSVSAPDLTAPRRKLLRRYPRSFGSTADFPGLDIAREGRSAELVRQLALGWS